MVINAFRFFFSVVILFSVVSCGNSPQSTAKTSDTTAANSTANTTPVNKKPKPLQPSLTELMGQYYLSAKESGISEADATRIRADQTYFEFQKNNVVVNHVGANEFPGNYEMIDDGRGVSLSFGSLKMNFDIEGNKILNKAVVSGNRNIYIKR